MSIRTEQEFPSGKWLQAGVQETQFTMVTGGPNTGKTRRVIERVAFLLQQGEFPPRITCLTVRDESAEHRRRRLRSHPGIRDHLEQMFVGTMTQCANTFLRRTDRRWLTWHFSRAYRVSARCTSNTPEAAGVRVSSPHS